MAMTLEELEAAVTTLSAEIAFLPTLEDIDNLSTVLNSRYTLQISALNSVSSQVSELRALYMALMKRVFDLENA